ncbi:glycosyltransferase family 4 protein [Acinetobacter bereziniae]|uniref:glycosyltransferase family 4 protein n=1 Tax=Acinetobacter bereziniae TaxID=106648 RepID=UPI0022EAEDEB|nr:glycosyltransferase family 4 protein [Acinetobacter bereziniae]MDA3439426.1 glycosyltransferase family 4 protein [Acinetobacter bereziniae]
MSKDVILDKYARLYEIPNQLSLLGHDIECFCLSYQSHNEGRWDESNNSRSLKWYSRSYVGLSKPKILFYPFYLLNQISKNKPDLIIAASDIPHIVIGAWIAKKLNLPFVADLYDNFESYGQAKIPFLSTLFHRALSSAKLISTTSFSLTEKISKEHPEVPTVYPMPSVIDKELFKPGDKLAARKHLNLPLNGHFIGTAGGLTNVKGINDLFHAWEIIKKQNDQAYLILAGPTEKITPLPQDDRVIYLGLLPHYDVVSLFQALDVGVLCIPDDEFGRYCFPQKAYEMLATNLPVIGTNIGDLSRLLNYSFLYEFNNYMELSDKIQLQLIQQEVSDVTIPDWKLLVTKLDDYLSNLVT